jgi:hypothetical protein
MLLPMLYKRLRDQNLGMSDYDFVGFCGYRAFLLTIGEEVRKYLFIGRKKSFGNSEYYIRQRVSLRYTGHWLR